MSQIGKVDSTHEMFQPAKRALRIVSPALVANRHGTHEEKQLWMKQRQELLKVQPPREPAQRHPRSPITSLARRLKPCQCSLEQIVARLAIDPALRAILNQEPPEWSQPTE